MSDKIRSITIVFEEDVSEQYIDMLEKTAICFQGVLKVERDIADSSTWAAETRIRSKSQKIMLKAIDDLWKN